MSRTLFENSKAALAFAAMTLIGAVAMVGTSDNGGVLDAAVDRLSSEDRPKIVSDAPTGSETVASEGGGAGADTTDQGWGSQAPVFGDYDGDTSPEAGSTAAPAASGAPRQNSTGNSGGGVMTAPLSSSAVVVERGYPEQDSGSLFGDGETAEAAE